MHRCASVRPNGNGLVRFRGLRTTVQSSQPKASSEGDVTWLERERLVELEGQLSKSRLALLSDELALRSTI